MTFDSATALLDSFGTEAKKQEGRLVRGHSQVGDRSIHFATPDLDTPFNLESMEARFHEYGRERGISTTKLLEDAGRHFTSSTLAPLRSPLTDEEISTMIEDDRRVGNVELSRLVRRHPGK